MTHPRNPRLGPSQWEARGTLQGWSIVDDLVKIQAPTLLLNGKYDMATDTVMEAAATAIPNAQWVRMEVSAKSYWQMIVSLKGLIIEFKPHGPL